FGCFTSFLFWKFRLNLKTEHQNTNDDWRPALAGFFSFSQPALITYFSQSLQKKAHTFGGGGAIEIIGICYIELQMRIYDEKFAVAGNIMKQAGCRVHLQ